MPTKPEINLTKLIGKRGTGFTGLQDAHIIGTAFYGKDELQWLRPLLFVNEDANFTVLPESERGSAALGVAAHYGNHNAAFDRFLYDANKPNKYLNEVRQNRDDEIALLPEEQRNDPAVLAAIDARYRVEVLNFLDFAKVLFLYDEIQTEAGYRATGDPQSLAFNVSDPRFSKREDVVAYYEGGGTSLIRQDLLDDTPVRAHPVFAAIEAARATGATIDDAWLVTRFPELSRMLYPGGEIAWATHEGAAYRAIQADILTRDAVLSGITAWKGTRPFQVERVDHDLFAAIVATPAFERGKELGTIALDLAAVANDNAPLCEAA